ncbi:DNA repair protein RAD5, putative [Plasmodium knowlesi strain H]|uniref:DNA repair protein RAD5, putative n=3 Tax=Plasmodium knowlesi TaxID=5850 RepID=A0A5K1UQL2_PLAKH|nr:DNA repair protein RAD5, putative [Plasmodium knowlesi strain H]OTN66498.1 putative DNA helicase [Plasmodium knowlesi]CAA9989905.1 DNA repair protein RAD5, putative [Plasmodium knowlesi strain H]SBO24471.1 DNA repair protein RAD5, putative [Plasmodium knowlesi strain H]SBO26511.1 DNA repair protein RAD5, putative [Plasmodium knowlesi strain H]VVS79379.1 DNA repair protein RAD5, putative [Plasmodium knowlesi strain H]|eukprot:XP_002259921.1 DNA helicase, putative [Plasmodium knowlesi strain H]
MTSSNYLKNEENNYGKSVGRLGEESYDSDVIEIISLNENQPPCNTVSKFGNFGRVHHGRCNYGMSMEGFSDIEIIEDISMYNYEQIKLARMKEFEASKKRAELIRDKGVFFEYYLGCIETDSIILSSEICDVKSDKDIEICYEITPKSTKRSYSPMYMLKVNKNYVISNDYIKVIGRNIPTDNKKVKKKKVLTKKGNNSPLRNEEYSEVHLDSNKILSADKKFMEFDKCKSEILKDINEGYSCIRIKHNNNRDISKIKSSLSKTLCVLLVLNAIRIEIMLEKVSLCDLKFGGSLRTFIHVILYPDSFKIDSHKFHEYNSLIKNSVDNLFKELRITPLRLAKNVDTDSFESSHIRINKGNFLSPSNSILKSDSSVHGNRDRAGDTSLGFSTPYKALCAPRRSVLDPATLSVTKEEEEIVDSLSENDMEENNEEATNMVFVEEKYRGGYLLEEFEEIHPDKFYFKPTLKTYQAEGVWWMYTKENPPEYFKEKNRKKEDIKEIVIDEVVKDNSLLKSMARNRTQIHSIINEKFTPNLDLTQGVLSGCKVEQSVSIPQCKVETMATIPQPEAKRIDLVIKREKNESYDDTDDGENDGDDIRNKQPLNPLWEEHAFIPNIKIYEEDNLVCVLKYFYVNKLTGCFSLTFPQYVPQFRGGILSDEMGLGKTIQSIGLIVHDACQNKLHLQNRNNKNKNNIIHLVENTIKGLNFKNGGTLIIAPLALIYQWKQEIEKHTREGFLTSYIYYGTSKDINTEDLCMYSVVLTTYSTLVSEYKNTLNKKRNNGEYKNSEGMNNDIGNKKSEQGDFGYIKGSPEEEKVKGEFPNRGEKGIRVKRSPESGKNNESPRINNFFKKTILGTKMEMMSNSTLKTYDDNKNTKQGNPKKECPLYRITWRRIIIDEAHVIKNKNSIQSIAVWKLRGERNWCLTGTPIQNSIFDIFPLFRFLGIKPYGTIEWWNKEIIDYVNRNKLNIALDVVRKISSPILLRRTKKSKTKNGDYIISLPKKNVHLLKLKFSMEEEDFYRAIFYRSKTKFDTYMHDGNVLSHYSHVLQLLLRLRQCCSHPLLLFSKPFFEEWNQEDINNCLEKKDDDDWKGENEEGDSDSFSPNGSTGRETPLSSSYCNDITDEPRKRGDDLIYNFMLGATHSNKLDDDYIQMIDQLKGGNAIQCVICLEDAVYPLISKCMHIMCKKCADNYFHLTQIADKKCPGCNQYISLKSLKTLQENKSPLDDLLKKMKKENFVYSTKLKQLFDHIQDDMKNELHIVVFSQWIGFLKIIQKLLTLHNIPNKIYDGSLTYEERKTTLLWFNIQKGKVYQPGIGFTKPSSPIPVENVSGKVLLCSLKAGGVGLNLTVSSKVYLMDLWWNPAIEDQAFERVHRIGQLKDVSIYKFVLEKTVEERILQIHQSKQYTANQILTQEGNKINTEMKFAPQKLGMDDFILMFKDWNAEE